MYKCTPNPPPPTFVDNVENSDDQFVGLCKRSVTGEECPKVFTQNVQGRLSDKPRGSLVNIGRREEKKKI